MCLHLPMKNHSFDKRCRYACQGLASAFRHEASFRTQLALGLGALLFILWLQPPLIWAAMVVVMVALVLAAELFNTALEHLVDGLHPEEAGFVRIAKDCAAAAVLVLSIAAVIVFLLMLWAVWG
jgi:diacylglycerol kinase